MTAPGNAERPENVRLILAAGQELPVTVDYVGNMTWRSVVSDPTATDPPATRVVIESDSAGRLGIWARRADGTGHGHRLTGSQFSRGGRLVVATELSFADVRAIRYYLWIWDTLHQRSGAAGPRGPEADDVGEVGVRIRSARRGSAGDA